MGCWRVHRAMTDDLLSLTTNANLKYLAFSGPEALLLAGQHHLSVPFKTIMNDHNKNVF